MIEIGIEAAGLILGVYGAGELLKYYQAMEDIKKGEMYSEPSRFDLGRYMAYKKLKR